MRSCPPPAAGSRGVGSKGPTDISRPRRAYAAQRRSRVAARQGMRHLPGPLARLMRCSAPLPFSSSSSSSSSSSLLCLFIRHAPHRAASVRRHVHFGVSRAVLVLPWCGPGRRHFHGIDRGKQKRSPVGGEGRRRSGRRGQMLQRGKHPPKRAARLSLSSHAVAGTP